MADRNSIVENETFPAPQAFFLGDSLQIFQDTTFQVHHIVNPFSAKKRCRFLATDAASTIHGDFFDVVFFAKLAEPFGEVAK